MCTYTSLFIFEFPDPAPLYNIHMCTYVHMSIYNPYSPGGGGDTAGAGVSCEKPVAAAGTGTVFHVLQRAPANQLRPCCKKRGRSYMGGCPVLFGIWIPIIPFACS